MDRIDVLGFRPERHHVFTKELLAEAEDLELQNIVTKAATELSSPMALVSLVLDQIQFFKAFVGLPPALTAARGTHRDASFCQFVVRDGKAFEVNDAPNDPRIPQHVVKEFNVQAYLGVPVIVENTVVGSLCVLDTKKRGFSEEDRNILYQLAALVNERLEVITVQRRQRRLDLSERAIQPGLRELSEAIQPIQQHLSAGYSAFAAIRSFLDIAKYEISDKAEFSEAYKLSLEAANIAHTEAEKLLFDIEACSADSGDCIIALERLFLHAGTTHLSDLVISAQDLARGATKLVGGFPLPEFTSDPVILTKETLAIAIISNCLLAIAEELSEIKSKEGIHLTLVEHNDSVDLFFSSPNLIIPSGESAINQLIKQIGGEPSVSIGLDNNTIKLSFKTMSA